MFNVTIHNFASVGTFTVFDVSHTLSAAVFSIVKAAQFTSVSFS